MSAFSLGHRPSHRGTGQGHRVAAEVHHPGAARPSPGSPGGVPGNPGAATPTEVVPPGSCSRCISSPDVVWDKTSENVANPPRLPHLLAEKAFPRTLNEMLLQGVAIKKA